MKRTRKPSLKPDPPKIAKTIGKPQKLPIKCCLELCKSEGEEFLTIENFLQHFVSFHCFDHLKETEFEELKSKILISLKCPTCKCASFKTLKTLIWHYGFKHEMSMVLNYVKKDFSTSQVFECPLCDYKSKSKTTILVEHICEDHIRNRAEKQNIGILLKKFGLQNGGETSKVEETVLDKVENSSGSIKVINFENIKVPVHFVLSCS